MGAPSLPSWPRGLPLDELKAYTLMQMNNDATVNTQKKEKKKEEGTQASNEVHLDGNIDDASTHTQITIGRCM